MAERADVPGVCAIVDTDLETDQVQPFIEIANVFVDDRLVGLTPPLSDDVLKKIETLLAAHYLTMFDPRVVTEQADGVRFTYESVVGLGLNGSKYGQAAQELDSSGTLKQLAKKDRVGWQVQVGSERDVEDLTSQTTP